MGAHEIRLGRCVDHVKYPDSSLYVCDADFSWRRGQDSFRTWALFASVYGVFIPCLSRIDRNLNLAGAIA